MKTYELKIILAAVALTVAPCIFAGQTESADQGQAAYMVKVTSDPAIVPLEPELITSLILSSAVADQAAADVFTKGQGTAQGFGAFLEVKVFPTGDNENLFLKLSVKRDAPDNFKTKENKLIPAVLGHMAGALHEALSKEKDRLKVQVLDAERQVAAAQAELRYEQEKVRNILSEGGVSRNRILEDRSRLQRDLQETEMERVLLEVTTDKISKRISRTHAEVRNKIRDDDISTQLKHVVDIWEEQLKWSEKIPGAFSDHDHASQSLAAARIELAQRQEDLSKSEGGELIADLNRTLADISMKQTQFEIREQQFQNRLNASKLLLMKADEYEIAELKADAAEDNLREMLVWERQLKHQLRSIRQPAVTILSE